MPKASPAYTAGIMDGEGSFMITRRARDVTRSKVIFDAYASVAMTDLIVLEAIHAAFGGRLYSDKRNQPRCKQVHRWVVTGVRLSSFIYIVRPYLIVKRRQADLVLEIQLNKTAHPGGKILTSEEIAHREGLYIAVKTLNQRGANPPKIVSTEDFLRSHITKERDAA